MKKAVLIIFSLFLFFTLSHKIYAANPPVDLLKDLLQILFSFQTSPNLPPVDNTPIPPPNTTPPADTTPGPTSPPGSINQYFPKPLNPISNKIPAYEKSAVLACQSKRTLYEQASSYTGVAWQILAAIHYVEANCREGSLVSGRQIGLVEPDLAGECSTGKSGLGVPIPVAGGCGMASLLDSAVYAARHLKGKIGKNPGDFKDLVIAFGRYNGLGNQNCGRTPYSHCPPYFESEDHIYPLNWFDDRHGTMYLVYCADHVQCNPPKLFERTGALTVLRILTGK